MTLEDIAAQRELLEKEKALLEQQQEVFKETKSLFEAQKQNLSYQVYDEAKTKLIRWASVLGSIVAIIAGLVGYVSFESVVARLAGERVDDIAELQLSPLSSNIGVLQAQIRALDGRPETIGAQLNALDSEITRSRTSLNTVEERLVTLNDRLTDQEFPRPSTIVTNEVLDETLRNRDPFILYNLDAWATVCGDDFPSPESEMTGFHGFGSTWIVFDRAFEAGRRFQTHDRIRLSSALRGDIHPQNFFSEQLSGNTCSTDAFYSNVSHSFLPFLKDIRELPNVMGVSLARIEIDRDQKGNIVNADAISNFRSYWKNYERALFFLGVNGVNYTLTNDPEFFLES